MSVVTENLWANIFFLKFEIQKSHKTVLENLITIQIF